MGIEVRTSDTNAGTIECKSMYEAHTWVIYLESHKIKCETFVDGILQVLPDDLQQPSKYQTFKSE